MDDDWDLEAVVRGCGVGRPQPAAADKDPFAVFPQAVEMVVKKEEEALETKWFSDLPETSTVLEELEGLYMPFFSTTIQPQPPLHQQQQQQQQQKNIFSISTTMNKMQQAQPQPQQRPQQQQGAPRSKRRKSQQKRVVCHVPADSVSSDMWAWRKYGQKPIKGSPYPRGYYRCSSSKGCLARKQVERSRADPGMLIITYTAEHNHPVPTHRNSLAGSTRTKFATSASSGGSTADQQPHQPPAGTGGSPLSSPTNAVWRLSPTASMEDEEEEEGLLTVDDVEMVGEDDLLFLGAGGGSTSSDTAASPQILDEIFPPSWLTAGGS